MKKAIPKSVLSEYGVILAHIHIYRRFLEQTVLGIQDHEMI